MHIEHIFELMYKYICLYYIWFQLQSKTCLINSRCQHYIRAEIYKEKY